MIITEMTSAHVAQIAALEKSCFSEPWSEASVAGELENPLSLWLVALCGERVVGYVGSQSVMDEADLMNLAVQPEYRRQGVAAALLTSLCEKLREKGVLKLTLEVRASNDAAKKLYESLDFQQAGVRPNYYFKPREDALILKKDWSRL